MSQVALDIAQKTLPDLIKDVQLGMHIVITKDEEPVAEMVPIARPKPKPIFGSARGLVKVAEDFNAPLDDFAEYVRRICFSTPMFFSGLSPVIPDSAPRQKMRLRIKEI